jgi:subfamily B ATP-binding cassette protein MsbA
MLKKGYMEIPSELEKVTRKSVFGEFWVNARSEKRNFGILLFLVAMQGAVAGGSIWLVKKSLDLFFESKDPKTALLLIGALFMATVMKNFLEFLFSWLRILSIGRIRDRLVIKAFRDLVYNPFRLHVKERDRKKYGWVLKDATNFIDSVFNMFNAWVRQPFILVSTFIALFIIAPYLTLVGIVLLPLGIPCLLLLKRKVKEFIAKREILLGMVEEMVSETIRSIRIIKVFGLEDKEIGRLKRTVREQREINQRNAFIVSLMSPVSEFLGLLGLSVIIVLGSKNIVSGTFTTGTFFVFIMSFLNIYRPLKDVSNGFMNYQLAFDSGRRLIILRQNAVKEQNKIGNIQVKLFNDLRIDDLWFSYSQKPRKNEYVLRGVNICVQKGQALAIVGATGSGKSTLCDLIFRLYRPERGNVYVNGISADSIEKQSFRRIFALCSQETIVFNNTLFEEIKIAKPDATRKEVLDVAEAVGLSSYIDTLNRGLDTWIGDRGIHCSGGQRQLVALARALLQQPEVLVLDEALSGVDVETSQKAWHNIRKRLPTCTILLVSHHWNLIKLCDRLAVLSDGRLERDMPLSEIKTQPQFFRDFQLGSKKRLKGMGLD